MTKAVARYRASEKGKIALRRARRNHYARHRDKIIEHKRKYRASGRGRVVLYNLPCTLDEMVKKQNGRCKACRNRTEEFMVDHDHACCPGVRSCGQCVRGLLCRDCNLALGFVGDSIERLKALIRYLEANSGRM